MDLKYYEGSHKRPLVTWFCLYKISIGKSRGQKGGYFSSGVGRMGIEWYSGHGVSEITQMDEYLKTTESHRVNFMVCELSQEKKKKKIRFPKLSSPMPWRWPCLSSSLQTPHRHGAEGEADTSLRDVWVKGGQHPHETIEMRSFHIGKGCQYLTEHLVSFWKFSFTWFVITRQGLPSQVDLPCPHHLPPPSNMLGQCP